MASLSTTPAYKLADYTFTGQFSYMDDPSTGSVTEGFGLMFYNARWYDPALGRFAQADTIIPPGVQGLDRYAYTLNNPLRYVDPSGHVSRPAMWVEGDFGFSQMYGVTFTGDFSRNGWGAPGRMMAVVEAVIKVGQKLSSERGIGESSASAFQAVFDEGVNFAWDTECTGCRSAETNQRCGNNFSGDCAAGGGFTAGNTITFASMTGQRLNDLDRMTKNVVHELGHVYYNKIGTPLLGDDFSRDALRPNEYEGRWDWQQHPPEMNADGQDMPGELFADTFLAWTYDTWNTGSSHNVVLAVNKAQSAMNSFVPKP